MNPLNRTAVTNCTKLASTSTKSHDTIFHYLAAHWKNDHHSIHEVINLYNKLNKEYKEYPSPSNEDHLAFNNIKTSGNWKKLYSTYPVNYLGYVLMLLSSAINKAYKDL